MDRLRLLFIGTVVWVLLAAMSLWLLGIWPRTAVGWLLVLALGPVVVLLIDALAETLGSVVSSLPGIRHADLAIERRTASERFSGVRVAYYLVRILLLLALILAGLVWLQGSFWPVFPDVVTRWWSRHFG